MSQDGNDHGWQPDAGAGGWQQQQQQQWQQQQQQQWQQQQPQAAQGYAPQAGAQMQSPYRSVAAAEPTRSHLLTVLLSMGWGGLLGFDRYYLGKIGTGMVKAVTLGGFGIWALYDLFMSVAGNRTDVEEAGLLGQQKRDPTMLLYLSAFAGFQGMDRFYLGQVGLGVAKLLTFGGFGLWWIFDLYLVLKGEMQDAEGRPIQSSDEKFQSVAFLFALKGGLFGIDRHYLGYKTIGMLKLFTFGGLYFWWIIDMIQLILNRLTTKDGQELTPS